MAGATGSGATGRRTSPRTAVAAALVLLALSLTAFAALVLLRPTPMVDTVVYRAEGMAVIDGTDLYGFRVTEWDLPATYPPFAAILFVPTALLPLQALKAAVMVSNVAFLALLVHLSLRFADVPRQPRLRPVVVLAATALGLWLEPVFQTLLFGQINLALACLVLWDLSRPDDALGKGFATGVAAGIKLTPAIFAVHLLLTGRVRAGLSALAGFACTVLLGALVLPQASVDFWTRRLYETGRVGKAWIVDNQSLQGLVARLMHTPDPGLVWQVTAVLVAVAGLAVARYAVRHRGLETWGVLCTAVTALLVSPISWSHHWVWCVPLLAVCAAEAESARLRQLTWDRWARVAVWALAVAFTARTLWLVPHRGDLDLKLPWWHQPLASPYPLLGLALLGVAAWRLRYGRPTPGGTLPVPAPRSDHRRGAGLSTSA